MRLNRMAKLGETLADAEQSAAAEIDYRNINGTSYVSSAKNQGSCGSCWSFTVASLFESYMLLYGNTTETPNYSEQFILECSGAGTCKNGGSTRLAINFAVVAGTCGIYFRDGG